MKWHTIHLPTFLHGICRVQISNMIFSFTLPLFFFFFSLYILPASQCLKLTKLEIEIGSLIVTAVPPTKLKTCIMAILIGPDSQNICITYPE